MPKKAKHVDIKNHVSMKLNLFNKFCLTVSHYLGVVGIDSQLRQSGTDGVTGG